MRFVSTTPHRTFWLVLIFHFASATFGPAGPRLRLYHRETRRAAARIEERMSAAERIVVVTNNYPSRARPNVGTFVANLVEQWAAQGVPLGVIAPQPYWSATTRAGNLRGLPMEGEQAFVLRPGHMTYSARTLWPGFSTARLSMAAFTGAVRKAAAKLPFEPAIAYAHFLFPAGHAALALARERRIPVVAALGEADFGEWEGHLGLARVRDTAQQFDGLLSVSRENADYVVAQYGVERDRIAVVPNAVDTERFHPRDRNEMRAKHGLPRDRRIVAFVGNFHERKGPLRVLEAIRPLSDVGAVFLGEGADTPQGEQVLFAGRVANETVPEYLSAADLYVLPTRAEGSPNSIIEAMACGLPVVSSDIPSLVETVPRDGALLVDPDDVEAIRAAVARIAGDTALRAAMGAAALAHATRTTLAQRAERIREWLGTIEASAG